MSVVSLADYRRRRAAVPDAVPAEALASHLRRHPVVVGDRLAVGPGGLTVIDARRVRGPIRVADEGFFRPRRVLRIDGLDRMDLVSGLVSQVDVTRRLLEANGLATVDIRGALLLLGGELPLLGLRDVQGVVLGRPRRIAKLVRRPGALDVTRLAEQLALL